MPIYLLYCVCYHVHCKLSEIKITTSINYTSLFYVNVITYPYPNPAVEKRQLSKHGNKTGEHLNWVIDLSDPLPVTLLETGHQASENIAKI